MKNLIVKKQRPIPHAVMLIAAGLLASGALAATDLADFPMAVNNGVTPNVLTIYDNSESMDAFMGGTLVSGDNPLTRGNIGRQVMRDAFTTYRSKFRWGLMSYELSGPANLYNTYVYYMGDSSTMNFTDSCVNGISQPSGLRCVANLQPFTGGNYVTYDRSSDDPDILDVLYIGGTFNQLWMIDNSNIGAACYDGFRSHNLVNSWGSGDFSGSGGLNNLCFTATDAGFTPTHPLYTRQYYAPRGVGYNQNITGRGTLLEAVQADSTTHYNNLISILGQETISTATTELKNAAVFTPLQGSLQSAKTYFAGNTTPVTASCQKNFVMLVTDGLPTGKNDGTMYSDTDRIITLDPPTTPPSTRTIPATGNAAAAQDAINAVVALRSTTVTGFTPAFDINTYVVALGDTVNNAKALAVMNRMAQQGGTDSALLATDSATFAAAIEAVSQDILSRDGAAAAVTVSNPNIVVGGLNLSYNSTYNSGTWTGDINAYPVDVQYGTINTNSPRWIPGAQQLLDGTNSGSRYIATYSGSSGIQFQPSSAATATKLTSAQETVFNSPTTPPGPSDSAAVIAYLRGDRSQEGTTTGVYRSRAHLLGDIVNAEPVMLQAPSKDYVDDCYSDPISGTCATSYKTSQASRHNVLFQGANDGMLHAFDAGNGTTVGTGAELWAYIPKLVWPNLVNLTKKTGFTHKYYVDATPIVGDVDFKNTNGGSGVYSVPAWRTILIGGLGGGGKGFYALDVTDPVPATEAATASKVLWEFPNNSTSAADADNMGYSYGRPLLVKTAAEGWVVIVPSGYNNTSGTGTGHGYLYVLNPRTGAVIRKIDTGAGSTASPAGLAKISGYVENGDLDNTVTQVYGGDLLGNVWRFDLTAANSSSWSVTKLASLVDSLGNAQPVTTEPELATITISGTDYRFVYVGTGQYLGTSDVSTTQTQTMYGLIDDMSGSTISPLRSNLLQQTLSTTGGNAARSISNNALTVTGNSAKKGWYVDLSLSTGERIAAEPQLALGALIFTTEIPTTTVCIPGGTSWYYTIDYQTGGVITNSTNGSLVGTYLGSALASRPTLIKLPSGAVKAVIRLSDTTTVVKDVPVPLSATSGRRVSWKEVITN